MRTEGSAWRFANTAADYAGGMSDLHYAAYAGDLDGVLSALTKGVALDITNRRQQETGR
jgi:hypothetical protein